MNNCKGIMPQLLTIQTNNLPSLLQKYGRAGCISLAVFRKKMLPAIAFKSKAQHRQSEVHAKSPYLVLKDVNKAQRDKHLLGQQFNIGSPANSPFLCNTMGQPSLSHSQQSSTTIRATTLAFCFPIFFNDALFPAKGTADFHPMGCIMACIRTITSRLKTCWTDLKLVIALRAYLGGLLRSAFKRTIIIAGSFAGSNRKDTFTSRTSLFNSIAPTFVRTITATSRWNRYIRASTTLTSYSWPFHTIQYTMNMGLVQ